MSDDGDETIDAGPEVLRAVSEHAAKLRAQSTEARDRPVRVWHLDHDDDDDDGGAADDGAGDDEGDDATTDLTDATIAPVGDDDFTIGGTDSVDLTVPLDQLIVQSKVVAEVANIDDGGDDRSVDEDNATLDGERSIVPATSEPRGEEREVLAAPGRVAPLAPSSPADPTAARDFVRESRERAAAAERESAPPVAKQRRSGAWIVLAVILGAQVIAGGVYIALTALGDDEQEAETEQVAIAAEATAAGVEPAADPAATPRTAPTPAGTPTAVPPTPTWRPVTDGPRSAPFTFFVEAIVSEPGFYDGRDGELLEAELGGRRLPLVNPLASGEPLVLRVVGGEPGDDWAQVELPGEAAVVWILTDEFAWDSTTVLLQIDLFTNSLRAFDENTEVFAATIASGTRSRPTPQLSTYVSEAILLRGGDSPGRIRLAHFGESAALSDGLGALFIESTDNSELFGTEAGYVTDGRILMATNDFARLSGLIQAGAKVEIVGVPAAPIPTPAAQVISGSDGGPGGGFIGCPPATEGSPPNCYRVVERLLVPGACTGREVQIDNDCLLIGGNPELDAFGRNCTSNAPLEIGGVCYLLVGPVPQLPGPCPEGAREVAGECRMPA